MTKDNIKLLAVIGVAVVLVAAAAGIGFSQVAQVSGRVTELEEELTATKEELANYEKYKGYLNDAKQMLVDSAKDLTTAVVEDVTWVENGKRGVGPFKADARAILNLSVEYTFGFDLAADKFNLSLKNKGLLVTLGKPRLAAAPNVSVVSAEFPPKSLAVEEEAAVQEILQAAMPSLEQKGDALAKNEAARILAEKKLIEHVRAFFAEQKNVIVVPHISVAYE